MIARLAQFLNSLKGQKKQVSEHPFPDEHSPVDVSPRGVLDTLLRDMAEHYLKARKRGESPATFSSNDIRLLLSIMDEAALKRISAGQLGTMALEEPAICEFVAHLNTAIALYKHTPQHVTVH